MTGEERRKEIIRRIMTAEQPVSGSALAAEYHVSRQVIVQDIALLRAGNAEIISTPRGYLLSQSSKCSRIITVTHTDEQIEDELNLIVDMGGIVKDVFVNHKVYGNLKANLGISSRRNVKSFMEELKQGKSSPLKNLTSGIHCHTIEADTEEELDLIQEELKKQGFFLHKGA